MNLILDKELVFRDLIVNSDKEALAFLANELYEKGYVKKEYIEAIQVREEEYPTGLPSTIPMIAIPHANFDLVNKTTLAIATLKNPTTFNNMENKKDLLPVQIIIMMAIGEPHGQVEMLQKIVNIIQDERLRKEMMEANDDKKLLELLKKSIKDN